MKSSVLFNTVFVLCLMMLSKPLIAQSSKITHSKDAKKWFKKNEWKKGLKLKIHPSVNIDEFAHQYQANASEWDKAFAYLRDNDLNKLPVGKYPIDGENVFASVTESPSKDFDKTGWESHKKYIDLQYVIRGAEKIGVAPVPSAVILKPYDETKDLQNYTTDGKYYEARPGTFFLFFPGDAHRPTIKVDGVDIVKKIVIKIRAVE